MACFGPRPASSWILAGGGGVMGCIVPFYSVQDCYLFDQGHLATQLFEKMMISEKNRFWEVLLISNKESKATLSKSEANNCTIGYYGNAVF